MKTENFLKDYARYLPEEDLRFVSSRLVQSLTGDAADVLEFLSRNSEIDKWLKSSSNSEEFYSMLDQLEFAVNSELDKRNQSSDKKDDKRNKRVKVIAN